MTRALFSVADIFENSELPAMKKKRHASFDSGIGHEFENGKTSLSPFFVTAARRNVQ